MKVSKEEVKYIAELAKLDFSEKEVEELSVELSKIISYVDKLNELNTENVEPLSHPLEKKNVFRDDVNKKSISTGEALKNAPDKTEQFFKVPKVIKQ